MQIPIGEEEKHEGVIDLLAMKAYHFLGENGMEITEVPIPEHLRADAEKYHNTLVERIAEQDEKLTRSVHQLIYTLLIIFGSTMAYLLHREGNMEWVTRFKMGTGFFGIMLFWSLFKNRR